MYISYPHRFSLVKVIPINGNKRRMWIRTVEYEPLHKSTAEHIRELAPRLTMEEVAERAKRPLEVIRSL